MKLSKGLKIAALALMALAGAFFMFMGVGEMLSGDLSGMIHLPPVALIILMMWFGWKKPLAGGLSMLVLGGLISTYFYIIMRAESKLIGVFLMGGPFLLFGLLFIASAMLEDQNRMRHI
ncbi:MAG: hypothetical protein JNK32_07385 [Anaerolineales bacterium]|nr:hypothetical protein [Anaerolineales bacterium]